LILQRYLLREATTASVLSLLIFVGVMLALFLAELLGDAAQGQLPSASVLLLLAFRLPEAVLLVGPLALMVGILMALGRLGEGSETVVMRSSGTGFGQALTPLLVLVAAWSLGLLAVSGWLAPGAVERTNALMSDAARHALVAGIRPGQFDSMDGGRLTVYVGEVDRDNGELGEVFVHYLEQGEAEMLVAERGRLWVDPADQLPYLTLYDGYQIRHDSRLATAGRREIDFRQNDIRLPVPEAATGSEGEMAAVLTELWPPATPAQFREWHWRLASPVAALLLGLLAVPLAQRPPRQGRFGVIVLALGLYLFYTNTIHAGLILLERRELASGPGLWPLHALIGVLAGVMLVRQFRRW